jgi:phospholipid/cholesterol/gamma-HCH transport system permease protein
MGAAQLEPFGAQSYIADLVTIGELREIAALVVGIVLSGRIGAAFAAQLASMGANEEIDALRTLGVRPVAFLVVPRLLALTLAAPLLTAFAAVVGMAAGAAVAVAIYDLTLVQYWQRTALSVYADNVMVGLVKGTVYGVLVALAGCRQGLNAGRSAEAVGEATTAAVVQSLVWIVVAASVLTIVFQRLGV